MSRSGARGPRRTIGRGCYRDRYGLAAVVWVRGQRREKRFPVGTPLAELRAWREDTALTLEDETPAPPERHTFAADVARYLARVESRLESLDDRRRDLAAWTALYGEWRRQEVTLAHINQALETWRGTHAASTVNHRRDALSNLYRVLDGSPGVVARAVRFKLPAPVSRAVPLARIDAVLAHIRGKTQARLLLMRWTGMRPSQMGRLTRDDLDLAHATVRLPRGKGGDEAILPLVGPGLDAARLFLARDAFGAWSCPSAYKAIVRAAKTAEVDPFTVYQIRHSLAAAMRQLGADLDDVRAALGHTDIRTTRRYSPVVDSKVAAALMRVAAASGSASGPPPLGD